MDYAISQITRGKSGISSSSLHHYQVSSTLSMLFDITVPAACVRMDGESATLILDAANVRRFFKKVQPPQTQELDSIPGHAVKEQRGHL